MATDAGHVGTTNTAEMDAGDTATTTNVVKPMNMDSGADTAITTVDKPDAAAARNPDAGAPPKQTVGDCNGLGGVDEFQNITPPGVASVLHVLADPVNSGTIYAGTDKAGLWVSKNCGLSWDKADVGDNAAVIDGGQLWSMGIDPVTPNVLYAGSLYASDPSLQRSDNGGRDWKSLSPAGSQIANTVQYNFLQELAIDSRPERHGHLLLTFHAPCMGDFAPMCMADTLDGGMTWRLFKGPTDAWVENARPIIIDDKKMLYVTFGDGIYASSDSGATWTKSAVVGANHQLIRTSKGTYYMGAAFYMIRSDDGVNWTSLDGTPHGDGLVSDGTRIFTSVATPDANQPYFTSAEDDGTTWKALKSPAMTRGAVWMRYDTGHKLLYSANAEAGLWRLRTK